MDGLFRGCRNLGAPKSGIYILTVYRPVRGYRNYFVEKVIAISQQRHGDMGDSTRHTKNVGDTTGTLWERN